MASEVRVEGVKELKRDLVRLFDDRGEANAELKEAGRLATVPILARVRATLPQRSRNLIGTLRATPTRTGATIRMGNAKVRYAGPVDFGGYPRPGGRGRTQAHWRAGGFRHRVTGQLIETDKGRPWIKTGRYLFPATQAERPEAVGLYSQHLQKAIDHYSWSHP